MRGHARMTTIGILGFGEAGSAFASALAQAGADVLCYDRLWDAEDAQGLARRRAANPGIGFCRLPELLDEAEIVLSLVTTDAALDVATSCLPGLGRDKVFCDLNSTAPAVKRRLDRIIAPTGARFVEGAILGAIGVTGARTQILLGGEGAQDLSAILNGLTLDTRPYSREIGKASAFKMLRSVFSKGLEALLVEFLMAGRAAGLEDDLWQEITTLMQDGRFEAVARNWVLSHAVAHERRYHEMSQVNELLRDLRLEATMSEATERFLERSTTLELGAAFASKPADMNAVIDLLLDRTGAGDVN